LRPLLTYTLLCAVVLLGWLLAGRRLVTLLDRLTLAQVDHPRVDRLVAETSSLELAGIHVDLMNSAYARLAEISLDSGGHVVLQSRGQQFPLGPGQPAPLIRGVPRFELTPDPGDAVLLTVKHSRIAWPTPFDMNFMTGASPSKKRNTYVRLRWTKLTGAKLQMLWKTEQSYYRTDGWSPPRIEGITDGLLEIHIAVPR
jgi:hypothetical protein